MSTQFFKVAMIIHQYMCEYLDACVYGRYKYWEVQEISSCIFTKGFGRIFCWLGSKGSELWHCEYQDS